MGKFMSWLLAPLAGLMSLMLGLMSSAHAAVPADVTAALGSIQADALTVAGVVLVAIVAVFAFKFLRKGL